MAAFFDVSLGPVARERPPRGRFFRCVRNVTGSVTIDAADEIAISMVLNQGAALNVRSQGRLDRVAPRAADYGLMVPGHPTHVSFTGEILALQMRLPLIMLHRVAEELDTNPDRIELVPVVGKHDPALLRAMWQGVSPSGADEGAAVREVAAYLLQNNASRKPASAASRGGLSPARLRRVKDFVETRLPEAIDLDAMAAEAALSPFHFARAFKQSTGRTPHGYLLERRLARALGLLQRSTFTLERIAAECGFAHASHLAQHLRGRYGLTSAQYREALTF